MTVWFDEEAIANWKADKTGKPGGQRVYSDMAIETSLVVRMVYKLAYRQTEGFLHSMASLLGLGIEIPDYSTLCRCSRLLRKKLRIPKAASSQPIHLMIDSTGLRIHVGTARKPPKQRAWRKLHIAVLRKTGTIVASELTASRARDATRVPALLTQIQAPLVSVAADSAYDKEAVYETIEAHSPGRRTRVVIPPQRNATLSQNSSIVNMLTRTYSGAVAGVDGLVIRVEVDLGSGLNAFRVVGLPDAAVREAQVRVRSALVNSGFGKCDGAITVNLAPADVKKQGSGFDLALALSLVVALEQSPPGRLDDTLFLGELALNGDLRRVRGVLPIVSQAVKEGLSRIVVPEDNVAEACLVKAAEVYSASSLREAVEFLSAGEVHPKKATPSRPRASVALDLSDVKGQRHAKRALEVAAAGGHNLLLSGPPGAGKSLLAMRLPSILPPLLPAEALEVTKIHSVAGLLDDGVLVEAPPFRSPHHTLSTASMVGGGSGLMPGEAS